MVVWSYTVVWILHTAVVAIQSDCVYLYSCYVLFNQIKLLLNIGQWHPFLILWINRRSCFIAVIVWSYKVICSLQFAVVGIQSCCVCLNSGSVVFNQLKLLIKMGFWHPVLIPCINTRSGINVLVIWGYTVIWSLLTVAMCLYSSFVVLNQIKSLCRFKDVIL